MRVAALIAAVVSLGIVSSRGTIADEADDQYLYASYCVGTLNEQLAALRDGSVEAIFAPFCREDYPTDTGCTATILRYLQKTTTERRQRFASYILARNPSISGQLVDAALIAIQRGNQDSRECRLSAINVQCRQTCGSSPLDSAMQCLAKCGQASPECARSSRCQEPDDLPF